jgi:hypothetical protein
MSIVTENKEKLIKRNDELKKLGKVRVAIARSGVSPNTYYRAINGEDTVTAPTLEAILSAQKVVIAETKKQLQRA